MSTNVKLSSNWNNILNLCIEFKASSNERKQIFTNIVDEFIELCEENKVKMTKKRAIRMMKAFLEIKDDEKALIKFKEILNNITSKTEYNQQKWDKIMNLYMQFNNKNKKEILKKIVLEFIKLCNEKNVHITKKGAVRMVKSFLEISSDIDEQLEFADLFHILMVADDFKSDDKSTSK